MSSKFNMTTATDTDLVNTLGVQRTIANAIDSAKPKSLDELLAVRGMSQEIIDELDSSVEIIYYEDSRNDPLLKPESNPVLISQTHDHLPLAADSTERMLRHLLDRQDEASRRQEEASRRQEEASRRQEEASRRQEEASRRQEEASRQQEEWRRYVDQRQNETNQVLLEMLGKLTGSVAEPPAGPPTVVNPVITEASCEEGKGTLCIGKNSSKKVRLGGELSDYVPDDNLAQRHTGNVRDEINVDIAQTADSYPHSIMNSPSSSQQQEFTSMPKLQNVYDTCVVDGVYQPNMSQSKKIIQNGLDLSGIKHADGQVIVDGVIRRPSIAPRQNPANGQSRQNPANMPTRQIPANMPIRKHVPRQADMYCEDDQVNDYHEYPQSHVWPPKALGPKPANMSPLPITILSTRGKLILMTKDVVLIFMENLNPIVTTMAPLFTVLGPLRLLVQTQPTCPCIAMFISTQETFILMPKDTKLILMERLSHVAITLTPLTPMLGLQCPPTQTHLTCYRCFLTKMVPFSI